ncbi:beta/gamma crystallin [Mobilisporobacter senegalensis]|uniref:Beta/gamma crystallin n=1 Tax=Mobilisporobacter senegalensis TaxID=1329262 RepID=A0A3N1XB56_9FIRM|nr:basic secretory protein-like protein [Mobilisporobacter senegalensis]ROR23973.1 beta/gamma crystallin [Mobilisporobacter senegalensis]
MKKRFFSVFLVMALFFMGLTKVNVQAAESVVTFYKDSNNTGISVALNVGNYTAAQLSAAGFPNDIMSSLTVPNGYLVEVYEHDNFEGRKWTFTQSSSFVGNDCNDKMSSVKILAAVFYRDRDYRGDSIALQPGDYRLEQLNAAGIPNDWVSSIRIPNGWTVEVYENNNFNGTKWTFTASSTFVGNDCNDKMSSVRIKTSSTPVGDWSNFQAPTVVFIDNAKGHEGSNIFRTAIPNVEQMMKDTCLDICKKLYNNNSEARNNFTKLNLLLENSPGVAWKYGDAPEIYIGISAQYIADFYHRNGNNNELLLKEVSGILAHEGTHGYQYAPKNCGTYQPGTDFFGFIEGTADYVRNVTRGFTPERYPRKGGHWTDGYNTTGFFIEWIVNNKKPTFAIELNRTASDYSTWSWDTACRNITGEGVQALWNQYQQSLQ